MGWLERLFGRQRDQQARKLDAPVQGLESLMRPSLSLVDSRDLTIPEKRARYALFTYGAVSTLARNADLDETEALALMVRYLHSTGRWHEQEISWMVGLCVRDTTPEGSSSDVEAGEQAMTDWLNGETQTAVSRLSQLLSP